MSAESTPANTTRRGRLQLLLLAAVCAFPLLGSWIAYQFGWGLGGSGNYGELLSPRAAASPALSSVRGKWVLVAFDSGACDAYCERKLYIIRQIRKAQGKEQDRLERVWFVTDAVKPRGELQPLVDGARVMPEPAGAASEFPGVRSDHLYLVDPLGNVMMRFPRDPDPGKMIKDLQRLLKYAQFG